METYYIYKISSKESGKTYIGKRKLPKKYFIESDPYMGSGKIISQYFETHKNYDIFEKEILAVCHKRETIDILEKEYIKLYKGIGKAEWNFVEGGDGYPLYYATEEQKKIWKENRLKTISNYSKERKEEIKRKKQDSWKRKMNNEQEREAYHKKQSESHIGKKFCIRDRLTEEECIQMDLRRKEAWAKKTKEEKNEIVKKANQTKSQWTEEKRKEVSKKLSQPGKKNGMYGRSVYKEKSPEEVEAIKQKIREGLRKRREEKLKNQLSN